MVLPGLVVCQLVMIGCDSDPGARPDQVGVLTVTSAVPNTGPTESTAEVRIYGRGFEAGATVAFGGVIANTVVVSATAITTMAPPHPEGAVDVVVTNPGGMSARLSGGYRYVPVALTSVAPSAGFTGSELRLVGTGFLPAAVVTLDGNQAGNVRVTSPVSITAVAPVHAPGVVDVVVTNPGGQAGILRGAFFYSTVSLSATPSSVMPGGELSVSWTASASESPWDWIGLFRVGASNSDYIDYQYTSGAISGTQTWLAPGLANQYEFRYLPNDGWNDVARSNTVTVVGTPVVSEGRQTTSRRAGRGGAARTRGR
jgi:hypothetical protein